MNSKNKKGKKKNKKGQNKKKDSFNDNILNTQESTEQEVKPQKVIEPPKKEPFNPLKFQYFNQKPVYPAKYTDSDNSEDEGLEDYKASGYHPAHVGEVLLDRYILMQKLGWGHFSTAWLAMDLKYNTYVAIKIQKSAPQYIDAAYDEVEILQELEKHNFDSDWVESVKEFWKNSPEKLKDGIQRDHSQIVQLLNSFIFHGQNGKHFCMVFEIMGVTLLEIIKRYNYKGIPLPFVRRITKQILIGLDFLHRMCGIIHTDLKPENVLVCLTQQDLKEIEDSGYLDISKLKNKKPHGAHGQQQERGKSPNKKENGKEEGNNKGEEKTNDKGKAKDKEKDGNKDKSNANANTNATANANANDKDKDKESENEKITKKQIKKKNQNYRKRQLKRLQKQGLSKEEIDIKIKEIMAIRLNETNRKDTLNDTNIEDFDINDIIERPRIASVPKFLINEEEEDNSFGFEDFESKQFDINIIEYSKSLQSYIKERNRVLTDLEYRNELIMKNKMLNQAKDEQEKLKILKNLAEKSRRGPEIDSNIKVKICDMGNACWFNHHFSTEIQTRQYRSPEVILGIKYNETADLWSLACMVFELVTGEFLFEPRKGETYMKNDDHLAQFIELLGKMPKKFAMSGRNSNKYFNKNGRLRRIKGLQYFPLKSVLMKKYKIKENEAQAFADFLLPMLKYYPEKRASAKEMLNHPWLSMPDNFDFSMSDWEVERMCMIQNNKKNEPENLEEMEVNFDKDIVSSEDEKNYADDEDNSNYNSDEEKEEESGDENPDMITIQNFNNSFTAYGQFVDLSALDRANPQFN